MKKQVLLILFIVAILLTGCVNRFTYNSPRLHQDNLSVSEDTVDLLTLCGELRTDIASGEYGVINSLLVMYRDTLVVEDYYNGWTADDPHQIQSISKSMTSLLVGIAIQEGFISSVHDPIKGYLPEFQDILIGEKATITIADLLTMSTGLEWDESSTPYYDTANARYQEMSSENSVRFVLSQAYTCTPGTSFNYSGGDVTVTGEIIQNAVGMPLEEFAEIYLFDKMQFGDFFWYRQSDHRLNCAGGMFMRPRDMVKIGQLVLDSGLWNGEQIVSKEWIEESTSSQIETGEPFYSSYGYYWWRSESPIEQDIAALGWGGQFIVIVPGRDLIIVITSENFDNNIE